MQKILEIKQHGGWIRPSYDSKIWKYLMIELCLPFWNKQLYLAGIENDKLRAFGDWSVLGEFLEYYQASQVPIYASNCPT